MKKIPILLVPAFAFLFSVVSGAGPGKAGMPEDFRGVIHDLFANHDAFSRSVEVTEKGYRAETTSKDPGKAALLQQHVAQMESRLEGGLSVRHWDPAFAELREHYDDMEIAVENIEGGIAVNVTGKTPEAVAVAKNHASIISGFIEKGGEQMHAEHAAVVSKSESAGTAAKKACCKAGGPGEGEAGCDKGECGKGSKPCCAARAGEARESEDEK